MIEKGYNMNCFVCGNEATNWAGHYHASIGQIITAGWCDKHKNERAELKPRIKCTMKQGCYGNKTKRR